MASGIDKVSGAMEEVGSGAMQFLRTLITNIKTDGMAGVKKSADSFNFAGMRSRTRVVCEINLVPDVKAEMIKSQKLRNLTLFIAMVVGGGSLAILAVFGIILSSQSVTIDGNEQELASLDKKVKSFSNLNEFLMIQGQLSKISELNEQKRNLSRIFSFLSVMLSQGADENGNRDKISISELTIDMDSATLAFEGQADAGKEPYIDYRVLEAFKKGTQATNYDFGRYVDENGKEIPARCIKDTDKDGAILVENGSVYGLWYRKEKGCDPSRDDSGRPADEINLSEAEKQNNSAIEEYLKNLENGGSSSIVAVTPNEKPKPSNDKKPNHTGVISERYKTEPEKIWRTPQFVDWNKDGRISSDGKISGVAHFESKCITYQGIDFGSETKWQASNKCLFAEKPMTTESSNGRNANGNLVLRFSAKMQINPEVLRFKNKHVMLISPSGRNVTDSYAQIENMFEQRATDCKPGDTTCSNEKANAGKDK